MRVPACVGVISRSPRMTSSLARLTPINQPVAVASRVAMDTMLAPGRTSRAPGTSCLGAARFSRLRGRLHGLLDSAREDLTWMRADHPIARDHHHGAEAPLVGGLR
jgi:hypothetical protein